ncbi:GNAT family N-acetyltransferase [Paraneptunicella aestuarii]|uniref:GNAT family N-acetyltransferase n=1 Tax=Paraneptunicella aestuarii TaxID=2831148 RepID=UPI001E461A5C|nr:GNAT family N-acetyltransferase [Paraneptunicella aestuarii]UAA38401.1 GNAT family N-acetyltransferase [Paraneptunicella aestuarii]
MQITLEKVDYNNLKHQADLLSLLDHYAMDEMGGGKPLSDFSRENLLTSLSKLPHAFSIILYVDDKPAALSNCFEGFSTFACKPLVNIHDFVVHSDFRGKGLSKTLMNKVVDVAKEKGCCKITLEVLTGNKVAYQSYLAFGFKPYELSPEHGEAKFMELYLK